MATGSDGVTTGSERGVNSYALAGAVSGETGLNLNLSLLEDSVLTEKQKLRHVLDWAQGFLGTSQEGNNLSKRGRAMSNPTPFCSSGLGVSGGPGACPLGGFHHVAGNRSREPGVDQPEEPSNTQPDVVFWGPKPSHGPQKLLLSSGPQTDTNGVPDQCCFLGLDDRGAGQTAHTTIFSNATQRSFRHRDSMTCCSSVDVDTVVVPRLPGNGPSLRAHGLTLSSDPSEWGGDKKEDKCLGTQGPDEVKVPVAAMERDRETGLDEIHDGTSRLEQADDHLETSKRQNSESLSVYEKYLHCVTRLDHLRKEKTPAPADATSTPADKRDSFSERPLSAPAELVVAKQPGHQVIPFEGKGEPFKSTEVKDERALRPKSSESQPGVLGQARVRGRGRYWRFWEKSSLSWSTFTHGEVLPRSHHPSRPHSAAGAVSKPMSTSEHCYSGSRPRQLTKVGGSVKWLCLPDEIWVSILTLLPHRDLSTVAQVCLRLLRLATDHTLWKDVQVENCSSLTDKWLYGVGRHHPRSLNMYRCSGLSITTAGLEEFFKLTCASLEELSVTSCSGPGLHGDRVLILIGQICEHLTSVDVSWSGATDRGIKALTDTCSGLKTVVVNGCQVTDEALIALVRKNRESLCRLEMFGCLSVSTSCVDKLSELCPGLEALNVGQVPKVTHVCLTLVTSRLKRLRVLNLTGLNAVSDETVHQVLLQCPELQGLTLSFCPGVTDLSMYKISSHAPKIRLLDVSGCSEVSDSGVKAVAVACRCLQHLDLSSTATGTRGVNLLANYCSTQLVTVKLSSCQISPEAVRKLCRHCRRLKLLHLYGCAYIPTKKEIRNINPTVQLYPQT
ncbi:hypothetical protein UPYG_G00190080 [Umbra pygmaea]|uniref:F-box domain-containing protein n=1 Tax=Umbra pygmaea TaxID=75934 RepID=A0ABD0WSM0_UMBPY